ncbi:MAG: hypothetical protein PHE58_01555, partial [Candidatus Omnitrophica bacterium]|nr:hypothetical protein [Candidatus Omnitrophota bacterium]
MKTFITCNLNENFVQRLVGLIEDEYINQGLDMSGLSLVFGGKRPALFVKKELSRRIKKSFIPPRFFSMDEFMRFAVERSGGFSLINDLDAGFIIYNLVKEHAPEILEKRAGFAEFLPWAREIVSFFEQLDLEDVQSTVLDNIRLNAEIGYDVPDSVNFLLTRLIFLRENFHRILIEKKQYSRGLMYRLAAQSVDGNVLEGMGRIVFCNFFYLHKTERELINTLCKAGISSLFVQGGEEWPVLNELARDFGFSFDSGEKNEPSYGLSVTRGFDIHSQVCIIRDIIKGIKNPDKTVIVMPDSNSLIPLLSEVSSFVPDFNVSMGYPLKRSVFYSLFDFIFKAQSTKKGDAYYAKDYLNLLSHPLIKNIRFENYPPSVTRILVHKIEEIIVGIESTPLSGSLFVSPGEIENLNDLYDLSLSTMKHMDEQVNREDIRKMVVRLHELLFFSWEKVECFSDFASRVDAVIQILVDKGFISGYPLHVKIIEKIRACAEALRNSSFSGERFSREDLFKIFRNKFDSEMISFSGSPLKGMQILGLLETRALNF